MEPGDLFQEKYRIEGHLGTGGQSQVFRAEEIATGRRVAIKLMHDDGHGVRFIREGRVVSKLTNPHIVRLIEFDRADSGQFFMAFEFVAGQTLRELAVNEAPLPWERVARLAHQMLEALAEAHELGIIHRDIKPSNVMLAPGEIVKVLDFGVAKFQGDGGGKAITATGEVLGTPRYLSPEGLRGDEVTPRADVYAVGLVAWELLAGRPANDERNSADIVLRHLDDFPFRLPKEVEISRDAKRWIESMTHKNPLMRPKDAIVALAELEQFYVPKEHGEIEGSTGDHERPSDLPPPEAPVDPTDTMVDVVPAPQQPPPQPPSTGIPGTGSHAAIQGPGPATGGHAAIQGPAQQQAFQGNGPPQQPRSSGLPSSIRLDPSRPTFRPQKKRGLPVLIPVIGIVLLVAAIVAMMLMK